MQIQGMPPSVVREGLPAVAQRPTPRLADRPPVRLQPRNKSGPAMSVLPGKTVISSRNQPAIGMSAGGYLVCQYELPDG